MKYRCTYTTGCGAEYEDGNWELKKTPKTTRLTKVEEYGVGVYSMHKVGESFKVGENTGNPMHDLLDGTFIVYFRQNGIPYYFEPTSD